MSRRLSVYRVHTFNPEQSIPHEMLRMVSDRHLKDREQVLLRAYMEERATPAMRREFIQVQHERARRNPNPPPANLHEPRTRTSSRENL